MVFVKKGYTRCRTAPAQLFLHGRHAPFIVPDSGRPSTETVKRKAALLRDVCTLDDDVTEAFLKNADYAGAHLPSQEERGKVDAFLRFHANTASTASGTKLKTLRVLNARKENEEVILSPARHQAFRIYCRESDNATWNFFCFGFTADDGTLCGITQPPTIYSICSNGRVWETGPEGLYRYLSHLLFHRNSQYFISPFPLHLIVDGPLGTNSGAAHPNVRSGILRKITSEWDDRWEDAAYAHESGSQIDAGAIDEEQWYSGTIARGDAEVIPVVDGAMSVLTAMTELLRELEIQSEFRRSLEEPEQKFFGALHMMSQVFGYQADHPDESQFSNGTKFPVRYSRRFRDLLEKLPEQFEQANGDSVKKRKEFGDLLDTYIEELADGLCDSAVKYFPRVLVLLQQCDEDKTMKSRVPGMSHLSSGAFHAVLEETILGVVQYGTDLNREMLWHHFYLPLSYYLAAVLPEESVAFFDAMFGRESLSGELGVEDPELVTLFKKQNVILDRDRILKEADRLNFDPLLVTEKKRWTESFVATTIDKSAGYFQSTWLGPSKVQQMLSIFEPMRQSKVFSEPDLAKDTVLASLYQKATISSVYLVGKSRQTFKKLEEWVLPRERQPVVSSMQAKATVVSKEFGADKDFLPGISNRISCSIGATMSLLKAWGLYRDISSGKKEPNFKDAKEFLMTLHKGGILVSGIIGDSFEETPVGRQVKEYLTKVFPAISAVDTVVNLTCLSQKYFQKEQKPVVFQVLKGAELAYEMYKLPYDLAVAYRFVFTRVLVKSPALGRALYSRFLLKMALKKPIGIPILGWVLMTVDVLEIFHSAVTNHFKKEHKPFGVMCSYAELCKKYYGESRKTDFRGVRVKVEPLKLKNRIVHEDLIFNGFEDLYETILQEGVLTDHRVGTALASVPLILAGLENSEWVREEITSGKMPEEVFEKLLGAELDCSEQTITKLASERSKSVFLETLER